MSANYNIIVNDVLKTKNKILCRARIDNYGNIMRRVSIVEYIRTDPFQLDFCDSIGSSNWILIFYPNGQYVESSNSVVTESGRASMYLKMVDCEHQHDSLTMAVRFFIKSPYCDVLDKFSCSKTATFSYCNLNERWSGPFNLAAVEELYSSRCTKFFLNDSLTVGCELDNTMFHLSATPPMMRLNENVHTADTSYSGEERNLTVGCELEDTSLQPYTTPTYTDDKRSATVVFQLADTTFLDYTPQGEMQPKEKATGTTTHQSVPQVHAKESPRRYTSTFNTDVKAKNEFKGKKNQMKMSVQEPFSPYRQDRKYVKETEKEERRSFKENKDEHDSIKEKEKKHSCACRNPNEMVSKTTQTFGEILRSHSDKVNESGTDNVCQSPSCCPFKSKVDFFEKFSSSKY